jgi:hypothetical protein
MLLSTFVYEETGEISENKNLPIRKYFSEFIEKLQAGGGRKKK